MLCYVICSVCIRELFPCILLYSKTRIHQRVTYIAFPEQAWDSGPNFTPVPLFTVEMESLVPVLTGLAPTKVIPLINTILNTFFQIENVGSKLATYAFLYLFMIWKICHTVANIDLITEFYELTLC